MNNPHDEDSTIDDNDFDDFDFDDDEDEDHEEEELSEVTSPEASPSAAPLPASAPATPPSGRPSSSISEIQESLVSPSDIPVILTIEVGRLQMTADYLFNLQKGNTLQLHAPLESGVWLCVNGKRVGRGELVRIGDVFGVRVLELGQKADKDHLKNHLTDSNSTQS